MICINHGIRVSLVVLKKMLSTQTENYSSHQSQLF
jgi:hypothetical protein